MAFKTVEKEINGKEVKIVLVGAIEGIKITTQLSRVLFPVIAAMKDNKANIVDLVGEALEHTDEIDLEHIIKKMFDGATADEFPIKPDTYFSGNYGELVDYLAFALEANFGSFFEAAILKSQSSPTGKKQK